MNTPFYSITMDELDAFFERVEFIPTMPKEHPSSHMYFKTYQSTTSGRPAHRFRGVVVNARRLSYFIFNNEDIGNRTKITMKCGVVNCVNPCHMSFKPKEKNI